MAPGQDASKRGLDRFLADKPTAGGRPAVMGLGCNPLVLPALLRPAPAFQEPFQGAREARPCAGGSGASPTGASPAQERAALQPGAKARERTERGASIRSKPPPESRRPPSPRGARPGAGGAACAKAQGARRIAAAPPPPGRAGKGGGGGGGASAASLPPSPPPRAAPGRIRSWPGPGGRRRRRGRGASERCSRSAPWGAAERRAGPGRSGRAERATEGRAGSAPRRRP